MPHRPRQDFPARTSPATVSTSLFRPTTNGGSCASLAFNLGGGADKRLDGCAAVPGVATSTATESSAHALAGARRGPRSPAVDQQPGVRSRRAAGAAVEDVG